MIYRSRVAFIFSLVLILTGVGLGLFFFQGLLPHKRLDIVSQHPLVKSIEVSDEKTLEVLLSTLEEKEYKTWQRKTAYLFQLVDSPQEHVIETKKVNSDLVKLRSFSYSKNNNSYEILLQIDSQKMHDLGRDQLSKDMVYHISYIVYTINHEADLEIVEYQNFLRDFVSLIDEGNILRVNFK
jgi:hypothetical protein